MGVLARFNKQSVNDRRRIKAMATELFKDKNYGADIKWGYKANDSYTLEQWLEDHWEQGKKLSSEYPKTVIREYFKRPISGKALGSLLKACWVSVRPDIAEVAFKILVPTGFDS